MRWGRVAALCIGLLLLVGVAGAVLAQQRLDPEVLRRAVIASVERQSGRSMTLERLDLRLLPSPHVSAEALTLGDRPGAADPVMLRIGHLEAGIGLWPLLRHVVRLDRPTLDHVTLHVLRDARGQGNWEMGPRPVAPAGSGFSRSRARWGVVFDSLHIDDLRVVFRDDLTHRGADVRLTKLAGSSLQGEQPHLELSGTHGGARFEVSGSVGPIRRLLAASDRRTPWRISLQATETIGGGVVGRGHASGTVADPAHGRGYDLAVNAAFARLGDLNRLFGHARLPSVQSLEASAQLVDAGHPEIVALQAKGGPTEVPGARGLLVQGWSAKASSLTGPVEVAASGSWHGQAVAVAGTAASLQAVQTMKPGASLPVRLSLQLGSARMTVAGLVGPSGHRVVPPWPVLWLADADLALQAPDLLTDGQHYRAVTAHAVLRDGRLLLQTQASGPAGPVAARLQLDAAAPTPTLRLWMHPVMLPAQTLARLIGARDEVRGVVELVGELQASGVSRSAFALSAEGQLGASMTDGVIANAALLRWIGTSPAIAAALPAIGDTPVRCAALHAVVGGGRAAIDTLSLRTGALSVDGHGGAGLADGGLELHLVADVKLGGARVTLPVRLQGSLRDPRPSLDRAGPGGRYALTIGGADDAAAECDGPLRTAREGVAGPAAGMPAPAGPVRPRKTPRPVDILRGLGILH